MTDLYADEAKEHRDAVYNGEHQSHLSHEVVAGGAAFEAMKLFEDRQRSEGKLSDARDQCLLIDDIS
jgi:hypothetical protein